MKDNFSLSTEINKTELLFLGQEGTEFQINSKTGQSALSVSAASRVLEVARGTIRNWNSKLNIETFEAQIQTGSGVQRVAMIFAKDFYKLAEQCKPELAEKILDAGANLYIYGLAGYKISLSEPEKPKMMTQAEAILALTPYAEFAKEHPGVDQIIQETNLVPCLFVSDIPFTLRLWVKLHHPSLLIDRQGLVRFGREVASVYRQLKLDLPQNSFTKTVNKYKKADHAMICQVFESMFANGLI